MKSLLLIFVLIFSSSILLGQEKQLIESINYHADIVANAQESSHRIIAQKRLSEDFEKWIQSPNFSRDQSYLRYLSGAQTIAKSISHTVSAVGDVDIDCSVFA